MSTERRFHEGDTFVIGNVDYRVVRGVKKPPAGEVDLRLDWRFRGEWQPVPLDHIALILDCIGENEDRLYPYGKGSAYVHEFLMRARRKGWRAANAFLHIERAAKAERDERRLG